MRNLRRSQGKDFVAGAEENTDRILSGEGPSLVLSLCLPHVGPETVIFAVVVDW